MLWVNYFIFTVTGLETLLFVRLDNAAHCLMLIWSTLFCFQDKAYGTNHPPEIISLPYVLTNLPLLNLLCLVRQDVS